MQNGNVFELLVIFLSLGIFIGDFLIKCVFDEKCCSSKSELLKGAYQFSTFPDEMGWEKKPSFLLGSNPVFCIVSDSITC